MAWWPEVNCRRESQGRDGQVPPDALNGTALPEFRRQSVDADRVAAGPERIDDRRWDPADLTPLLVAAARPARAGSDPDADG